MKMNGWGLRVELAIILMFLICLVVAAIGLNRLGLLGENSNSIINGDDSFSYETLEDKLEESTKKYIREYSNNNISEDKVIIRYTTLYYNGYITKLVDNKDRECSGYTEVIKNSSSLIYFSYVKCPGYETKGYEKSNDW